MKYLKPILVFMFLIHSACKSQNISTSKYESENLKIEKLTENTYVHISYLETDTWGKVPCNGMIVVNKGEAIVFDTPTNDVASSELISWLKNDLNSQVKAVVATHFHIDCIGGLGEFHENDIPSYATNMTIGLMKNDIIPKNGFDKFLELEVGNKRVINQYFGEGHTIDNIICYFPSEQVMFGGCLLKSLGAGKGNLEDANVKEWSKTVEKVKTEFPLVEIVIPGHGKTRGTELLDFTISLFNQE